MKKYIDLLTIGNLSPDVLKILTPLRSRYNIVSCRSMASTELVTSSKLILQQNKNVLTINNDVVEPIYIEDYLENVVCTTPLKDMDTYYSVAANKSNIKNFITLGNTFGFSSTNTCLLIVPISEFKSIDEFPDDVRDYIEVHAGGIEIIYSELNYDYSRLIPAVKYMLDNDLDDKNLVQLNLDLTYSLHAIYKLNRLINETEDLTITNAATPDTIFDTALLSNAFTFVKPKFFNSMLWEGLRNAVIENSTSNYWHTFNLWVTNVCKGSYYCKFEDVPFDNSLDISNIRTKAFYNELARIGINKLLTDEE